MERWRELKSKVIIFDYEYISKTFIKYNEYLFVTKFGDIKMPRKDGTGPEGKGSKTGRQMGDCEGAEPQSRKGFGRGCRRFNRFREDSEK